MGCQERCDFLAAAVVCMGISLILPFKIYIFTRFCDNATIIKKQLNFT